jgi:hypothetical protein
LEQWRFNPPTHVIFALAQALDQFDAVRDTIKEMEEETGAPAQAA